VLKMTSLAITIKEKVSVSSPSGNLYSSIIKDNTFANPKYVSNIQYGYSNQKINEKIETFSRFDGGIALPRGYLQDLLNICDEEGIITTVKDLRATNNTTFPLLNVKLRPYQKRAVNEAMLVDQGIIVSPTGSGKTLIGLEIIRQRKQKTLIILHRADLARQWSDVIFDQFGIKAGMISEGNFEIGEEITIAMVQTLSSKSEETRDISELFGLILVDENHHIPAQSFSQVVGSLSARYAYGLSATLGRSDGLEEIIYRSIGNIVATVTREEVEALGSTVPITVQSIKTGFNPGSLGSWNDYLNSITDNKKRNSLILSLACKSSSPSLILTDRVEHAEILSKMLDSRNIDHVLAHGKLKTKERVKAMASIQEAKITIGTAGLLGEGLDVSGWGVLIMANPISSEIKLMQAIGRIVRPAKGKTKALVCDLTDDCGFAGSSFKKRFEIYKKNKIWVKF